MLSGPDWLALEVKYLDRACSFYGSFLDLEPHTRREGEAVLPAGDTEIRLRAPGPVPRGGVHTHYALSIPAGEYDRWYDRLDERFDLVETRFGDSRSLYFYDTAGHCVELGESPVDGPGVDGLFEVVFEVEDLARAIDFYTALGCSVGDRGEDRARLNCGEFALELWEPRLGIADARGGVHVDLGASAEDPAGLAARVADDALATAEVGDAVRVRDPDGHYLTLR